MSKTLTYSGFVIAALLVIMLFVTSKSYTQLAVAVIAYPVVAYFALKLLPSRNGHRAPVVTLQIPTTARRAEHHVQRQVVEVADIDKRTFLKVVGAAGLSFFLFSLLGRRIENLFFGRTIQTGITGLGGSPDSDNVLNSSSAISNEYKITEIDEGVVTYYGFTSKSGNWLIMREDTENNSFRYAKGDSDFPRNWARREKLQYDYFNNLF